MKLVGVVIDYDGYNGMIEANGDKYLLLRDEIVDNEVLQKLDNVSFVPEIYKGFEVEEKVARFVRKIKKD